MLYKEWSLLLKNNKIKKSLINMFNVDMGYACAKIITIVNKKFTTFKFNIYPMKYNRNDLF